MYNYNLFRFKNLNLNFPKLILILILKLIWAILYFFATFNLINYFKTIYKIIIYPRKNCVFMQILN